MLAWRQGMPSHGCTIGLSQPCASWRLPFAAGFSGNGVRHALVVADTHGAPAYSKVILDLHECAVQPSKLASRRHV